MRRLVGFVMVFLLCWVMWGESVVQAARKIRFAPKQGKAATIQEQEIAWSKPTKTQAQTWILWAWNEQGYMITAFWISTRFMLVSRLGVQLTIHTPAGKVHHLVKEYTMDKVKGNGKRLYLKVAGKHWWDGGLQTGTVHVDYDKWGCNLRYRRTLQGYRHMKGPMRFGSSIFEGITFGPRLSIEGKLRVDGKTINFSGVGYADYSLQTITPKSLARRWYAARAVGQGYTVLAHQLLTVKKWEPRELAGISIAKGDQWEFISLPRHITYFRAYHMKKDKAGYLVPMRVLFKAKADNGTRYEIDIKHTKQLVRLDLLSHVNAFLQFFIRRLLSNPFVFRYQARLELNIYPPKQPKIRKDLTAYTEWLFVQ